MGLAERRATKEFQDNHLPALQKEIEQAAGFPLTVDVKWESLATPDQAHLYEECWEKVYFTPLLKALRALGRDDMGKEALKGVKKVVIENEREIFSGESWARFDQGVLHLDHKPTTNVDSIGERTDGLVKLLENAL
jgi:hypothetical protein